MLSVAYADVSHLYDNSNGYNYPRPTIPFPPPTQAPRCAPGLLGVYPDCYAPTTPTPICPPGIKMNETKKEYRIPINIKKHNSFHKGIN